MQITTFFDKNKLIKTSKSWLMLAIFSVALAGVFSILIAALRTPKVQSYIPFKDFFKTALVAHVDLSVLVFLVSMISMFSTLIIRAEYGFFAKIANRTSLVGALLIFIAPFSNANPILNNYIPVLENLPFFLGIGLFITGVFINNIFAIISFNVKTDFNKIIYSMSLIITASVISFLISGYEIKSITNLHNDSLNYYERIFWSFGHILQFAYVHLMMLCWLYFFDIKETEIKKMVPLFYINSLLSISGLFMHIKYEIDSGEFISFFTQQMRYCGAIAPVFMLIMLLKYKLYDSTKRGFLASFILFTAGGVISLFIKGSNVIIPAHYHGSIVGVTLSLMCFTFLLLDFFYKVDIKLTRLERSFPVIYCLGQLLHIIGLAWSGGYGALRKTPGELLTAKAKISMGLMGAGGLIAIIGGTIFIYICIKIIYTNESTKNITKDETI